ncbi:MAG: AI-2E family transporter [Nitrospinota bacterium]|nr:AI-2E family transporter [Nitrospinota bacterium]
MDLPEEKSRDTARNNQFFFLFVFLSILALMFLLRDALFPFLAAFFIAYLLDPTLDKMEERNIPRTAGVLALLAAFFLFLFLAGFFIYPVLENQITTGVRHLPEYAAQVQEKLAPLLERLGENNSERIKVLLKEGMEKVGSIPMLLLSYFYDFMISALSSFGGFVSALFDLVVIPVAAFYFMRDIDNMKEKMTEMIPERHREKVRSVFAEINSTLSAFVRGQFTVSLVMAFFYSVGLYFIGTPMGLFIGLLAGFANVVPYLPLVAGLLPALILTYFHFDLDWHLVAVLGLFASVQALEGFYLTPKVMGKAVGLHPLMIMAALLIGGVALGFVGVIIAVPAAAVIMVFWRHFNKYYKESEFYGRKE